TCSSAEPGSAPACWKRITLSRNTISVGIDRMLNPAASSCSSSVLTLAKTTSGCVSEAFSYTGAKPLHGPHQGAQKSMITIELSVTVFSNVSLVSSIVATAPRKKKGECTLDNHAYRPVRPLAERAAALWFVRRRAGELARRPRRGRTLAGAHRSPRCAAQRPGSGAPHPAFAASPGPAMGRRGHL